MANRLKAETSPYLLQHVENPVDWFPWGEEAFAVAQAENKPIFLSVGYAACHWCHVMAHESFEDPEVASIMNEFFVNVKVDREERLDVDSIYMDAVVTMTGQGGWPMSVFLTPYGEPFYGGTYFPPSPRYNMPSFRDVLLQIKTQWDENRERLLLTGEKLKEHIASTISLLPTTHQLDRNLLDRAAETLFKTYDWANGGWGGAPKFPQPSTIEFLLRKHHRDGDKLALDMATHALRAMARGGIYDQLGGGFHRYAVDAEWLVPHFEKMLYDNALLAQAYLHAWQLTGDTTFRQIIETTLDFLLRRMRNKEGGFFTSLDADSEGEEGKYYVWKPSEIRNHLGDDDLAELFIARYGMTEEGNFEGSNVLHHPDEDHVIADRFGLTVEAMEKQLTIARQRLLDHRSERVPPATDDKVLTAWNGLLLTTYAEAARALDRPDYLRVAQSLANFLLETMLKDGRLHRAWRSDQARFTAYLEDHAALGEGLLVLYQTDFNPRWYIAALEQAEEILAHFTDSRGGFFDTRDDHETLIARPKSVQDSPMPSGNTLAVSLLMKLAALTGDSRYSVPAESALMAMQDNALRYPTAFAGWLCAIDFAIGPQLQLALIGIPTETNFNALAKVVHDRFLPNLVLAGAEEKTANAPALLESREMQGGDASAYLCLQFACKLPTTSPEVLLDQIEAALSSVPS